MLRRALPTPTVPVPAAGARPVATGRWLRDRDRSTESTSVSRAEPSRPIAGTLAPGSTTVKATRRTAELVTAPGLRRRIRRASRDLLAARRRLPCSPHFEHVRPLSARRPHIPDP